MIEFSKAANTLLIALLSCAVIFVNASSFQLSAQTGKIYQFINGNWFDGKNFGKRIFYSVNGTFASEKPQKIDETIDLKNGFVIPPFADAHTHNFDGARNLEKVSNAYLNEGTFYVQVLGNYATGAKQARPFLNKPSTLDVVYANGMLTSTYGHPFMVYEPFALGIYNIYEEAEMKRSLERVKKSRLGENNVYWFLDSRDDVDAKWRKILDTKPDLIKISLLDAENYARDSAAGEMLDKGLSPVVAEYVVRKAHEAGLRVYAHIETADDFRLGVKIGVDGFAHAPYYGWDGQLETAPKDDLTAADIRLAARKKVVVVPPTERDLHAVKNHDAAGKDTLDAARFGRVIERQKKLYNALHRGGVRVALGSDKFGSTLADEIQHFHENEIFDDLTLLKIAVETTPRAIFPNRKIGKLRTGYEANFLVLDANPLIDFKAVKNIRWRFKQGFVLEVPTAK